MKTPSSLDHSFWPWFGFSVLAASLAFLTFLAFFPGCMPPDSMSFLSQAVTGHFLDLHPPLMAATWRLLLMIWGHPGALFVFHVIFFWFLWAVLAVTAFRKWKHRFLTLAIPCLPPLWSQVNVILTDTELSLSLLAAYLLGILASRLGTREERSTLSLRTTLLCLAFSFFFYSAGVRGNALPALVPLAFFLAFIVSGGDRWAKALFLAGFLCIVSIFTSHLFTYGYLKAGRMNVIQLFKIYDIVGIMDRSPDPILIPDYWKMNFPGLTLEMLVRNYSPYTEVPLSFEGEKPVPMTANPLYLEELDQKWRQAIRSFPREWLGHHWSVFRRLMGVGEPKVFFPFYFDVAENPYGVVPPRPSFIRKVFRSYFDSFRDGPLFRGWLYLGLLAVLMGYQHLHLPRLSALRLPGICSALSGFLYGLGYFLYPPSAEFRLLYPMVALFFFSAILTLAARREQGGLATATGPIGNPRPPRPAYRSPTKPSKRS